MLLGIRRFLSAAESKFKMSDIRRHSIVLNLATHLLSLTRLAKRQSYLTPFDRPCVIAHYCSNEPQVTISITQRLRSQAAGRFITDSIAAPIAKGLSLPLGWSRVLGPARKVSSVFSRLATRPHTRLRTTWYKRQPGKDDKNNGKSCSTVSDSG